MSDINVGDYVFFMRHNKIHRAKVYGVKITKRGKLLLNFGSNFWIKRSKVAKSAKELFGMITKDMKEIA